MILLIFHLPSLLKTPVDSSMNDIYIYKIYSKVVLCIDTYIYIYTSIYINTDTGNTRETFIFQLQPHSIY